MEKNEAMERKGNEENEEKGIKLYEGRKEMDEERKRKYFKIDQDKKY